MLTAFTTDSGARRDAWRLLEYAFRARFAAPLPEVRRTPEGKPYFPGLPNTHFSLSHTPGRSMVCIADAPCGCDVQALRPVGESVIRRVCTEAELAEFAFFELWCLKESFIKLTGRFVPYRDMEFRRRDGIVLTPRPNLAARLYPEPGFQAAIVAETALPDIPDRPVFVAAEELKRVIPSCILDNGVVK